MSINKIDNLIYELSLAVCENMDCQDGAEDLYNHIDGHISQWLDEREDVENETAEAIAEARGMFGGNA